MHVVAPLPELAEEAPAVARRKRTIYERADRRRKRRRAPEIPSRAEVKRLLSVLSRRADAERDYPLFLLALETGMRAGTLAGLTVGDVRGPDGYCRKRVRLRADLVKGGYAYTVPLRRRVRQVLNAYLAERDGQAKPGAPLFPSRKHADFLTVRAVEHAWRRWQREAGWERMYRLHAARHYAITRMAERIGNPLIVKALAGHQSISTTQRYAHPSDDALQDAVEEAFADAD
jgi:integrase